MNMNEVLATLAGESSAPPSIPTTGQRPQSSNDVFPSAIHLAATQRIVNELIPALEHLAEDAAQQEPGVEGGGQVRAGPT